MKDVQQVIVELDEVSDMIALGHTNHVNVRLIGIIDGLRLPYSLMKWGYMRFLGGVLTPKTSQSIPFV